MTRRISYLLLLVALAWNTAHGTVDTYADDENILVQVRQTIDRRNSSFSSLPESPVHISPPLSPPSPPHSTLIDRRNNSMRPRRSPEAFAAALAAIGSNVSIETSNCNSVPLLWLIEMADLVYDLHDTTTITRLGETRLPSNQWTIGSQRQQPDFSAGGEFTPAFAVFTRTYGSGCKQAVLTVKGTSPGSLTDLTADLNHVVLGSSPDAAKASMVPYINQYRNQGYNVLVTGHSLGGFVGEIMSTTYDLPGAVFCAPGPVGYYTGNNFNGGYARSDFHSINAEHDSLGNLMYWMHTHVNNEPIYVNGHDVHGSTEMIARLREISVGLTGSETGLYNANVQNYVWWSGQYQYLG